MFVTYFVRYSHCHGWHNVKFNGDNNGHGLKTLCVNRPLLGQH